MVFLAIFCTSIFKKSDPEKAFADENAPIFYRSMYWYYWKDLVKCTLRNKIPFMNFVFEIFRFYLMIHVL